MGVTRYSQRSSRATRHAGRGRASAWDSSWALAGPRLGNLASAREVVHDKDQPMVMVGVQNLDVDPGLGHPAREQSELTGHVLLQSLYEYVPFREDLDAGRFQRPAGGGSVR